MSSLSVATFNTTIATDGPTSSRTLPVFIEISWVKHLFGDGTQGYEVCESIGDKDAESIGRYTIQERAAAVRCASKRYLARAEAASIHWKAYMETLRDKQLQSVK